MKCEFGFLALAIMLSACAVPSTSSNAAATPDSATLDLTCPHPGNCVNSRGTGDLPALRYTGTPAQAMTVLMASVASFPEATVVRTEPLSLELIFTTPAGFRDQVDFRIDTQTQRIDFRSRSLVGLFDFGKNRSRMQEFSTRFEQQSRR